MNQLIEKILNSQSLAELRNNSLLPEPYADSGYYFVYYSRKDYKTALRDIVMLSDDGLRIWYDRKVNAGDGWEQGMLARARDFHCVCAVLYLSAHAMRSPFFWKLCALIKEQHLVYCTVNLPDEAGKVCSGAELAATLDLSAEQLALAKKLFSQEITYIPGTLTFAEKRKALDGIRKNNQLVYTLKDGCATVTSVKDLSEEQIVVPEKVAFEGAEYTVKAIAPSAFAGCERLREIHLPDCIEHVGELTDNEDGVFSLDPESYFKEGRVFQDCKKLEEIRLPASLKTMYTNLFVGCVSLKRIYFGDEVLSVRGFPYFTPVNTEHDGGSGRSFLKENGPPVEELKLPSSFIRRDDGTILYPDPQRGWGEFSVPDGAHVYGYTDAEPVERYTLSEGEKLGARFQYDKHLRILDMRLGGETELDGTLLECSNLEEVYLPQNAVSIEGIFDGCSALKRVVFGDKLQSVGSDVFSECESLKEITLPESTLNIASDALNGSALEAIVFEGAANPQWFQSENLFQKKYRDPTKSTAQKVLFTIFSPLLVLGSLLRMLFSRMALLAIALLLSFPVSFWVLMLRPTQKPFFADSVLRTVYLRKRGGKAVKLKGFVLVPSDRDGYDQYVRKHHKNKE